MTQSWYSDLLYWHAAKWGLEIPEPRPLIDDDTSPYPRAHIIEKITLPGDTNYRYTEIALVTLNDQYSYTLNYQWHDRGCSYLPFLKFCDPYPTQADALAAGNHCPETHQSTAPKCWHGSTILPHRNN